MLNSIATVSVSGTLSEKLLAIAEAGFDGIEIFENDLIASDMSPEAVRAMVADLGMTITVYQPFRNFEGLRDQARIRAFDRAERKFDLMQRLGTELLLVCSNVLPDASGDRQRIVSDFHALGERAAARGLRVAYEGLAWGRHIFDHRDVAAIVGETAHPSVGMVLDSFHSLSRKIPLGTLADIDVDKLFLVQLADAPLMQLDVLQWSRHFRCMPLQGNFDMIGYVSALNALGYQGPLSLEIFNDRFRAGSASQVACDGRRSLVLVRDEAARLQAPHPRAWQAPLPFRASCSGIAFIEFAANEGDADRLGMMLVALGFVQSGRHRSRAISRWTQQDINIVINSSGGGLAGSYEAVHGVSICAIGLLVPDVPAVIGRADALKIPVFHETSALDAHSIPALRGLGGSLVYLIGEQDMPTLWQSEFETLQVQHRPLLEAVDHVGAVVGQSEFLSWTLYWRSLFDLTLSAETDLLDPGGLVQSQALQTAKGKVRFTLNGSGGVQTLSARFLGETFGAGFQHIALRSEDIFQAATTMRAAGLAILPIPSNYYDDIAARYSISHTLLERMRKNDILYDEDTAGNTFFQFYARAFDKRFFFEIVQRKDYDGYGEGNAQVRLTAQARFRDSWALLV